MKNNMNRFVAIVGICFALITPIDGVLAQSKSVEHCSPLGQAYSSTLRDLRERGTLPRSRIWTLTFSLKVSPTPDPGHFAVSGSVASVAMCIVRKTANEAM
jgi:hypothetical protein